MGKIPFRPGQRGSEIVISPMQSVHGGIDVFIANIFRRIMADLSLIPGQRRAAIQATPTPPDRAPKLGILAVIV